MGKINKQSPLQHHENGFEESNSWIFFQRCSMGISNMCKVLNFKCFLVVILSLSVFLPAIYWGLPHHSTVHAFDAISAIKNSAKVQARFRLQKPVSILVPLIRKLEYDINEEIGVPSTKVAILSMHPANELNSTDVNFGLLSDPMNSPINAVSLSVLRSSFVGLFLQQTNLTLTNSTFGQPSLFEIVIYPGGITVIPGRSSPIWQIPQIFFNFTLPYSISYIKQNFDEMKEQLTAEIRLMPDENVYVQVSNDIGSTEGTPVIVQVSVTSDQGGIPPERLKQLAETITGSAPKNLGLDNSVFGKVKQISLSTYFRSTLHASSPTPSPAPSPGKSEFAEPSYPPDISPAPSIVYTLSPSPGPDCSTQISPSPLSPSQTDQFPPTIPPYPSATPAPRNPISLATPGLSPLPAVGYSASPVKGKRNGKSSESPNFTSHVTVPLLKTQMFLIVMLSTFHLLRWA